MATKKVDHVVGGDECKHAGATLSGERTNPDNGEWAEAIELGAQRFVGDFGDRRRGRQPQPRLHVAGAGLRVPLHVPDQRMQFADKAMGWCGAAMRRALPASTGLRPGAATGRCDSIAPAVAEGSDAATYGQAPDLMHACTSQEGIRDRQRTGSWTDETLHAAMDKITDEGMKLKVAAKIFGIPSSYDHLYGRTTSRQRGTKPTLKAQEEKKLVDYVFKMQDLGHPLTPLKLCLKVATATQTKEMP